MQLSEFLKFIVQFRMKNIECFSEKIANDVTELLSYPHKEGYAHRDLKPSNILISNQHYADITDNIEREKAMKDKPIIGKIADFGESRSRLLCSMTLLKSQTRQLQRGTFFLESPD